MWVHILYVYQEMFHFHTDSTGMIVPLLLQDSCQTKLEDRERSQPAFRVWGCNFQSGAWRSYWIHNKTRTLTVSIHTSTRAQTSCSSNYSVNVGISGA